MPGELDPLWSNEEIASLLQLLRAGVPESSLWHATGVDPDLVASWAARYSETFAKLIQLEPLGPPTSDRSGCGSVRRVACLTDYPGSLQDVIQTLQFCKIRYLIVQDSANAVREALGTYKEVGCFQSLPDSPEENLRRRTQSVQPARVLVSVKIDNGDLPSNHQDSPEKLIRGAMSGHVDEIRWRRRSATGDHVEASIWAHESMSVVLWGILDTVIEAIRLFYTSSMDALLLGNCLIQKSWLDTDLRMLA